MKYAISFLIQVRGMVKKLIVAQKWAEGIRNCLSKVENWSCHCSFERVQMDYVNELLDFDPLPCNEPGHLKLKVIMICEL